MPLLISKCERTISVRDLDLPGHCCTLCPTARPCVLSICGDVVLTVVVAVLVAVTKGPETDGNKEAGPKYESRLFTETASGSVFKPF